ncbi:MAG: SEL1-like repeat protein [Alistipes sp.]|nr:SEL1-like repeat protein [Alistipes sp.]
MKRILLLFALLLTTAGIAFAQSVTVNKIWLEKDVTLNSKLGMKIHFFLQTDGLKDVPMSAIAYFDEPKGVGVKDTDGRWCTTSGTVAIWADFTPPYESSVWNDFWFFVAYDDIHIKDYSKTYYCHVFIFDKQGKRYGNSEYVAFQVKKPVGTAVSNATKNTHLAPTSATPTQPVRPSTKPAQPTAKPTQSVEKAPASTATAQASSSLSFKEMNQYQLDGLDAYMGGNYVEAQRCFTIVVAALDKLPSDAFALTLYKDAYSLLGLIYYRGHGVTQNYDKAFKLFKKAAELEAAMGQFYLGCCYCSGRGVEEDVSRGLTYWVLAARQDHEQAQEMLTKIGLDWRE